MLFNITLLTSLLFLDTSQVNQILFKTELIEACYITKEWFFN